MKYILFFAILALFVFFLVVLFSDLKTSLKSIVRIIPPDPKTPSQRKKARASYLKSEKKKRIERSSSRDTQRRRKKR